MGRRAAGAPTVLDRARTWIGRRYRVVCPTREIGSNGTGGLAAGGRRLGIFVVARLDPFDALVLGLVFLLLGGIIQTRAKLVRSLGDELRDFEHQHVEEHEGDDTRRQARRDDVARPRRDVVGGKVTPIEHLLLHRAIFFGPEAFEVGFRVPTKRQQNHRERDDQRRKRPYSAKPIELRDTHVVYTKSKKSLEKGCACFV